MIKWRWVAPSNRDVLELVIIKYENDKGFQLAPDETGNLCWQDHHAYDEYKPALRVPGDVLAVLTEEMARDMFTPRLDYSKEQDRIVQRLKALREFVQADLLEPEGLIE